MNVKPVNVIHILGGSGSGTTTLAKEISERYGYIHLDTDDYFWKKTDPPYTDIRDVIERQNMLKKSIDAAEKCVISGSLTGWGDMLIPRFDLVIYLFVPTDIRIKRLKENI